MDSDPLVFFGTGPVSLASLESLGNRFEIEAVITKPDRQTTYGQPLAHPVRSWANDHRIPVHQPANASELDQLVSSTRFASRVGLVVDYGIIIPGAVIQAFPLGLVNSHFSLLPEWRGADPITAAILSGQAQTGVSLMLIAPTLDTGDLLAQEKLPISPNSTSPSLTAELIALSNKMIQKYLPQYLAGKLSPFSQQGQPTYSHKLTKSDGQIDWNLPAQQIERQVRAYLGWPGSRTHLLGTDVTITAAHVINQSPKPNQLPKPGFALAQPSQPGLTLTDQVLAGGQPGLTPGQPIKLTKDLAITTGSGALVIDRLIPAGKRAMTGREFLAGRHHL